MTLTEALCVAVVALGLTYGWVNDHEQLVQERKAHQTDISDFNFSIMNGNTF